MTVIRSLEHIHFDSLFDAFSKAFADYEMQLSKEELYVMLSRRGFVPELSFGAFENEKLLSFTFNGIGEYRGKPTAYDTGTGTLKEYRGQGLASAIFEHAVPVLQLAGISQYVLEVLQHNSAAVSVYQKQGFQVSREFNYFMQRTDQIKLVKLNSNIQIRPILLSDKKLMTSFWDFQPSWQNSFEAIARRESDFKMIGAYQDNELLGYCIFDGASGDFTQLAVARAHRRSGIGTTLIKELLPWSQKQMVKFINTETTCLSILRFLESLGIPLKGKQFEMIRQW